jgi:hypothetical protein
MALARSRESVQRAFPHGLPASVARLYPEGPELLDVRLNPAIEPRLRPAVYGLGMYGTFAEPGSL